MASIAIVSGANGLIGYALIKRLIYHNFTVHALVRKSSNIYHLKNLTSSITFHYSELEDYDQFDPSSNVNIFSTWHGREQIN